MNEAIAGPIVKFISGEILNQPRKTIQPGERLISSGLIDSLHLVDLALFVEDKFGVIIDNTDLNKDTFDTLEELVALIEQRRA